MDIPGKRLFWIVSLLTFFGISSCSPIAVTPEPTQQMATAIPSATTTATPAALTATATPENTPTPTATSLPEQVGLDPSDWMNWPVNPIVTQHMREVYALGLSLGNDPRAFSILGDCQSTPDSFLGLYVLNHAEYLALSNDLQETVDYFASSLNRESPTSQSGTTSGALLFIEWHAGKHGCTNTETPLVCEIRINNPSFAIIMVGTHWEARNEFYMRKILDQLLERGIIPILYTKADNREKDHAINLETASLAAEYNLPLWNFWRVTDDLPNRGLYTKKGDEYLGDIYLTEEALNRHRLSALQALNTVWRAVADLP